MFFYLRAKTDLMSFIEQQLLRNIHKSRREKKLHGNITCDTSEKMKRIQKIT